MTGTAHAVVSQVSLTADKSSPGNIGTVGTVTLTAVAQDGLAPQEYRFWIYKWTPTSVASYQILVYAREAGSTANYEARATMWFHVLQDNATSILDLKVDKPSPAQITTLNPATFTAEALNGSGPFEYQFWIYNTASASWSIGQNYSTLNTWQWTPVNPGSYIILVYVRTGSSSVLYETKKSMVYNVVDNPPVTYVSLIANQPSPAEFSTVGTVLFNATAFDGTGPHEYQFRRYDSSTGKWSILRDYSTTGTVPWTPSATGSHMITVYARSAGSAAQYEAKKTMFFDIVDSPPVTGVELLSDRPSPFYISSPPGTVNFTAFPSGGSGNYEYQFWLYDPNLPPEVPSNWIPLTWTSGPPPYYRPVPVYTTESSMSVQFYYPGNYKVLVYARNSGSNARFEAQATYKISIVSDTPVTRVSLSSDFQSPFIPNFSNTVTFTATAQDGVGPQEYQFWIYNAASTKWSLEQDYSTSDTFYWDLIHPYVPYGSFKIVVHARSAGSAADYEAQASTWFDIAYDTPVSKVTLETSKTSPGELSTLGNVLLVATADIDNSEIQFWIKDPDGTWSLMRDYCPSTEGRVITDWIPSKAGAYEIVVYARTLGNDTLYDAQDRIWFVVTNDPPVTGLELFADMPSPFYISSPPGTVNFTALASGGSGNYEYQFWLYDPNIPPEETSNWIPLTWTSGPPPYYRPVPVYVSSPDIPLDFYYPGRYIIKAYARNVGSTVDFEVMSKMVFMVSDAEPVTDVTLVANTASPFSLMDLGGPVEFSAHATDGVGPQEYQFWIKNVSMPYSSWSLEQDYGIGNKLSWDPSVLEPPFEGSYMVKVYARSSESTLPYEAQKTIMYTLTYDQPVTGVSLVANTPSPASLSSITAVEFSANASGGNCTEPPVYQFWLKPDGGQWSMARDYDDPFAPDNTWSWTPQTSGSYQVMVYSKCAWSFALYEAEARMWFHISDVAPVTEVTLTSDMKPAVLYVPDPINYPETVTFTANALDGTGPQEYQFWLYDPNIPPEEPSRWMPLTWTSGPPPDFLPVPVYTTDPVMPVNFSSPGDYKVLVYSRSSGSNTTFEAKASMGIRVTDVEPVTQVSLIANKPSPAELSTGGTVLFKAVAMDGIGPQEYQFRIYDPNTAKWGMLQDYSTSDSATWTPTQSGSYQVLVYARSAGSIVHYEAYKTLTFNISDSQPVTGVTLKTDKPDFNLLSSVGTVTITAGALDGTGPQEYLFRIYDPNTAKWVMLQDYSTSATTTWTPTATGSYNIHVLARSAGSTTMFEAHKSLLVHIVQEPPATGVGLSADRSSPVLSGETVNFLASASGGSGSYEYQYWLYDPYAPVDLFPSKWVPLTWTSGPPPDYQPVPVYTTDPNMPVTFYNPGVYRLSVRARNVGSDAMFEVYKEMLFIVE
jgi:hypothetical protein